MLPSYFYTKINDRVRCDLCPHFCFLKINETGTCTVRKNIDNKLYVLNFGELSSIALDPIEKKPLFHFHPNEKILSLGSWGCNLKCQFCQNFEISQFKPKHLLKITPNEIPFFMKKNNIKGVAYTYSEPIVWYEFVYETSKKVKNYDKEYYNILVTNGFINEKPLNELLNYIDAVNIDLKTFNSKNYSKNLKGKLKDILRTIELSFNKNIHVEITSLIVPKINDDLNELEEEFKWISKLSKNIPLHISKYYPAYNYTEKTTELKKLIEVYKIAKKYLNFVYIGNIWNKKYESTYCPNCGEILIEREGYNVKILNIDKNGGCKKCGQKIVKY